MAAESRAKTAEITAIERTIRTHVPEGMTFETFLGLLEIEDVDRRIESEEAKLKRVGQAATIKERPLLPTLAAPSLPSELNATLEKTIEAIAENAEQAISAHLAAHGMDESGRSWIEEGLAYANSSESILWTGVGGCFLGASLSNCLRSAI